MMWVIKVLSPLLGIGILILTLPRLLRQPADGLPKGMHLPGIVLELPDSPAEVKEIPPALVESVKESLPIDTYLVVPLYVALFVAFAVEFGRQGHTVVGWLMASLTLLAGISDELENHFQTVLLTVSEPSALEVNHVWRAGTLKWACLSVVVGLLGTTVLSRRGLWPLVTGVSLLSSAFFWAGLSCYRPLVQYAFSLMGLTLLVTGVLAWFGW